MLANFVSLVSKNLISNRCVITFMRRFHHRSLLLLSWEDFIIEEDFLLISNNQTQAYLDFNVSLVKKMPNFFSHLLAIFFEDYKCILVIITCLRSCVCMCLVAQLCPTFYSTMNCSLPGSSVHGIFQARILELVAISYSRGSSWPRDRTGLLCLLHWQENSLPLVPPRKPLRSW